LSAIENGLQPKLALVDQLARVLCVHPDELLRTPPDVAATRAVGGVQEPAGTAA
jgi:hypothetical protein